jgi:hypothetical protein
MRSRLVHGGKYPSLDEIKTARDDAQELARRGLLRAVQQGFPYICDIQPDDPRD